jgi:predicted negative regulator of RcsB-dependent stress response
MAIDQIDEYEQGEKVRSWLRDNGGSLLTGIALGLAMIFGWQTWQGSQQRDREEGATQFAALVDAIEAKDEAKVKAFAAEIDAKHGDTPFATLSRLRRASFLQSQGKQDEAIALLKGAPAGADPALAELQSLRLARLQLIAGKPQDALKTVEALGAESRFAAVRGELLGDIQVALGKRAEAIKAYESALTAKDQAAGLRRLVELKLIDAGGKAPAAPEA